MELQAGQPTRKGNKRGPTYAYIEELRDREIELARDAEPAYERFVSQWQRGNAKRRTGAASEERR
jgi:transposase